MRPVEGRGERRRIFRLRGRGPMIPRLAYVMGAVVMAAGAAMIPAAITSLIYREWTVAVQITLAAAITVLVGFMMWRLVGRPGVLTT